MIREKSDTKEGFHKFQRWIQDVQAQFQLTSVLIGMDNYELTVFPASRSQSTTQQSSLQ